MQVTFAAYQIVASVSWSLEVSFPQPYQSIQLFLSSFMDFSIAAVLPVQCLTSYSYHTHLLIVTLCPLISILILVAVYLHLKTRRLASYKIAPPTTDSERKNNGSSVYLQAALMVSL